jgi:hypothetical protein
MEWNVVLILINLINSMYLASGIPLILAVRTILFTAKGIVSMEYFTKIGIVFYCRIPVRQVL